MKIIVWIFYLFGLLFLLWLFILWVTTGQRTCLGDCL